jgi:MFS family permease
VKLRETVRRTETVKETLTEGWDFVREVASFRYLMFALAALAICDVILEFRFLSVSEAAFVTSDAYQRFYSFYRLGFTLLAFAVQTFVTGAVVNKVGLKQIFLVYPVAALTGLVGTLAVPGIVVSVAALLLEKLSVYAVDEPARKSFQALVPEERRGRVSIFMDSYLYAGGSIVGVLLVLIVVGVGDWLGTPYSPYIYLGIGVLAALFALWSIFQMRRVYDKSLFNWRLKRRQRRSSVLDSLDF